MSRADAPNSSQAQPLAASNSQAEPPVNSSPAVAKLVSSAPRPPSVLPPAASGPGANNNAQRTSDRSGVAPYAASGKTTTGDSVYAGVAGLKGRDPKSGGEAEVLSFSGQVGAQNEAQLGLVRVAGASGFLSGSAEAFTLRANIGIHNDDGSTGLNIGAGGTAVGLEGTLGRETSVTYGLAGSVGSAASIGVRDLDGDGAAELCARVSLGPITVGICLENPL